MAATTFLEPPAAFSCAVCDKPSHALKAGPSCETCPAFKGRHYYPTPLGDEACDVLVIGDAPLVPLIPRLVIVSDREHVTFDDVAGKVVQSAVGELQSQPAFSRIRCRYIYAVKCAVDNPSKKIVASCSTHLSNEIRKVLAARAATGKTGPLTVVAHGVTALRALHITVASENEAAGQVYTVGFQDATLRVVATRGMKSIAGTPGKYSSLKADFERAFRLSIDKTVPVLPREQLEAEYIYPRTIEEVRKLCDMIIAYAPPGNDPAEWAIAVDTETNTLFPHRDGLQLTIVSFAWAPGQACAIPLWHKDTPYDPELAWPHVVRVLTCNKKKIFHNAKYDLKVFWNKGTDVERLHWDVMLSEHALEEDKKGQYGLKYLTKQYLPQYAGYEDQLHAILAKVQGERQLDNARKEKKEKNSGRLTVVPPEVIMAMERLDLAEGFQVAALRKRQAKLLKRRELWVTNADTFAAMQYLGLKAPFGVKGNAKLWNEIEKGAARLRSGLVDDRGEPLSLTDIQTTYLEAAEKALAFRGHGTDPWTPDDDVVVTDIETVLKAHELGFLKAPPKGTEKSGGFENIPLWDTTTEERDGTTQTVTNYKRGVQLFYAAVDADVTRQLAVLQVQRMLAEDAEFQKVRRAAINATAMEVRRDPVNAFTVRPLCALPNPILTLAKGAYIARARELASMEYHGVRVDMAYVRGACGKLTKVIEAEKARLFEMAGEEFKLGASNRIAFYLFDGGHGYKPLDTKKAASMAAKYPDRVRWDGQRIRYRGVSYTGKGALQTTEKVLTLLAETYECDFARSLLMLRKALKARDTFFENASALARHDGKLHTNYNQNGTATARLSSNDINMQNIPKGEMGGVSKKDPRYNLLTKEERAGVSCKAMFICDDDTFTFVNADAKGAEVSVFAAYSKDASLIQALRGGMDAHSFFSSLIYNPDKVAGDRKGTERTRELDKLGIDDDHAWSYDDFANRDDLAESDDPERSAYGKRLKKLRDIVKRVIFGILFGAGKRKIAELIGIEESVADTIIKSLFAMFPTIPAFIEHTKWELRTLGMVETYFGRRRRFAIRGAPKEVVARAERQAVNFKIQSTNSDIVLWCLTEMAPVIRRDFGGRMLLTVHDSLGFQVKRQYVSQLPDFFKEYGTRRVAKLCPWFPVDFRWDIEVGRSYGELCSIPKYLGREDVKHEHRHEAIVEEEMLDAIRMEGEGVIEVD